LSKSRDMPDLKEIQEYMMSFQTDMDKRFTDLKAEVDDIQQKAAKKVMERPLLALGVAFAVGMAIGIALANAGD